MTEASLIKYLKEQKWPKNTSIMCKNLSNLNILAALANIPEVSMVLCVDVQPFERDDINDMKIDKLRAMDVPTGQMHSSGILATVGIAFNSSKDDLEHCVTDFVYIIGLDLSCKKFEVKP